MKFIVYIQNPDEWTEGREVEAENEEQARANTKLNEGETVLFVAKSKP